ncbi:DJ-1/PfpI/YhbO family deglycase/protease [Mucilaginibacter sp.]|uniref:DJ-1/PfpI/YhbO family deglycase/protease n=1 Tax=Mucilaginibacter sp. TaxID=1882438 RepID=UPI00261C2928|nr:DJ-1/PfpI/YhbO family deglycase/protease [Mucilaginibacter sp.]MDB4926306.1 intracellular protease, PfpI family [Mucilaginibacter sp.]
MKKRAVIVVGPAVEDTEYAYPYYRLQEDGFIVDTATNGMVDVMAKHGLPIKANADILKLNTADYDMLIVPGGLESPDRLRQIPELLKFIQDMNTEGKVIASVCHGPWVLISAQIVKGKDMTIYKGCKDDLINAGANYHDVAVMSDGNIVTAPHFRDNAIWVKTTLDSYYKINS